MERLQILPRPIHRLNVSICIEQYEKRGPAIEAAQLFLKSFRDLRNVAVPTVDSVVWVNSSWQQIDLLGSPEVIPGVPGYNSDEDQTFAGLVKRWKVGISREGPAPDVSPVVHAYWILHHICFDLQIHHQAARVVESNTKIYELLLQAKKAREAEDMTEMRNVGRAIQSIWRKYQEKQRTFESRISKRVDFVDGLLAWDVDFAPVETSASMQKYEGKGKGKAKDINGCDSESSAASSSWNIKVEQEW
jgi:G:T-mismatch repair DNA endonuclease (very short patch repair protein)